MTLLATGIAAERAGVHESAPFTVPNSATGELVVNLDVRADDWLARSSPILLELLEDLGGGQRASIGRARWASHGDPRGVQHPENKPEWSASIAREHRRKNLILRLEVPSRIHCGYTVETR